MEIKFELYQTSNKNIDAKVKLLHSTSFEFPVSSHIDDFPN